MRVYTSPGRSPFSRHTRHLLQTNLSDLPTIFAEWVPEQLRLRSGLRKRRRPFTQAVVFWLFLSQCLTRGESCRAALRKLMAWLQFSRRPMISGNTSAYCQARKTMLSEPCLRETHHQRRDAEPHRQQRDRLRAMRERQLREDAERREARRRCDDRDHCGPAGHRG